MKISLTGTAEEVAAAVRMVKNAFVVRELGDFQAGGPGHLGCVDIEAEARSPRPFDAGAAKQEAEEFAEAVKRGETHVLYSERYKLPCVVAYWATSAQEVIDWCRAHGAMESWRDTEVFCVAFRPHKGPGLINESALRGSRFPITPAVG